MDPYYENLVVGTWDWYRDGNLFGFYILTKEGDFTFKYYKDSTFAEVVHAIVGDELSGKYKLSYKRKKNEWASIPAITLHTRRINLPVLGPVAGLFSLMFEPVTRLIDFVTNGDMTLVFEDWSSKKITFDDGYWLRRNSPIL